MLSKLYAASTSGTEGYLLEVEVDVSEGLPAISVVGLPDEAVREAKERVKSAIKNCGYLYPGGRITVNLAPADIRKEGPSFDLAIALGILASSEQIPQKGLKEYVCLGELALDGNIRRVNGVLPITLYLRSHPKIKLVVPQENLAEAAIVSGVDVFAGITLTQVIYLLTSGLQGEPVKIDMHSLARNNNYDSDFSEVKGQYAAKRAMEVAASGFHNILMIGPPGAGKTMLAKRLPGILPRMCEEEIFETTKIYSIAGLLSKENPLITTRPFRVVHHTSSDIALVGGGGNPRPGEVSLAHNGVLFLDELAEFHRDALESLRQPLEDGKVTIARANRRVTFLSRFLSVSAMNPCPCGFFSDTQKSCRCLPQQIIRYRGKVSGPLLDRIDIHIDLPATKYSELVQVNEAEASADIRARVEKTHLIQLQRLKGERVFYNGQMNTRLTKKYCVLTGQARKLLEMALTELGLSGRGYNKVLRLGRTIADMAGSSLIDAEHIAEAVQYRSLDRQLF